MNIQGEHNEHAEFDLDILAWDAQASGANASEKKDMTDDLAKANKHLHALVSTSVPKAQTVEKYGGTLFTLRPEEKEGQFCGVFPLKSQVQISFSDGAHLDDPDHLLKGSGKGRRHINFSSTDEMTAPATKKALTKLIKQAAKMSGLMAG